MNLNSTLSKIYILFTFIVQTNCFSPLYCCTLYKAPNPHAYALASKVNKYNRIRIISID